MNSRRRVPAGEGRVKWIMGSTRYAPGIDWCPMGFAFCFEFIRARKGDIFSTMENVFRSCEIPDALVPPPPRHDGDGHRSRWCRRR